MLLRAAFAFAAGLAVAGSAAAKDAQIGSATLTLPSPDGYCELTDKVPADARLLKQVGDLVAGGQNELLSMSADCSQLDAWRAGVLPALDDYVQYQTLKAAKDSDIPRAEAVKGICTSMREEGGKTGSDMATDIATRVDAAIKDAKFDEVKSLGVLAEDANACYFALLVKGRTEIGDAKVQLTTAATTVVKGKLVYYYLYAVHRDGANTVNEALARHQRNVPALLAANGDLSGPEKAAKDEHAGAPHAAAPVKETPARPTPVKGPPGKAPPVKEAAAKESPEKEATIKKPAVGHSASFGAGKAKGHDAQGSVGGPSPYAWQDWQHRHGWQDRRAWDDRSGWDDWRACEAWRALQDWRIRENWRCLYGY